MRFNKKFKAIALSIMCAGIFAVKVFAFSDYREEITVDNMITEIKKYQYRETKYQVELIEVLEQAKKDMIPVAPLLNKIKEGLAKDVSLKDILEAVIRNKGGMKLSQALLDEFETRGLRKGKDVNWKENTVITLGGFFARGLSEETFRRLTEQVIQQKGEVSKLIILSGMFVDLKEKNIRDETLWNIVDMVLGQNFRDVDASALINSIYYKVNSGGDVEEYVKQLESEKPTRALIRR